MKPITQIAWALACLVLCVVLFLNDWVALGCKSFDHWGSRALERARRRVA